MHSKRLVVSIIVLPILYFYIMYLSPTFFFFLLLVVSILGLSEFFSMYRFNGLLKYVCLLSGTLILVASFFEEGIASDAVLLAALVIIIGRLLLKRNPYSSLSDIALPVVGIIYIPWLLSFQWQIRQIGPEWIIFLYVTVWASDSLAYYIGKGIGKRRLYPEVSPNKTIAGAGGSLLGGAFGALFLNSLMTLQLGITMALFIGIMVGIISIIGDLVESMFKRDAGVKDSGYLIPGHGGVLDKIDSVLFAGPLLYWILKAC